MKQVAKSKVFSLTKGVFGKIFDCLRQEYDLFGPTIKKGQGIYSDTDLCVYAKLDYFQQLSFKRRTYFSAKELASAISEKLFDFTPQEYREPGHELRKRIIFARSCDIEGFTRLDKIYLENGPLVDFYYKRFRDTITFFLIECADEGFEDCFCQSVGADETKEFALSILERDDKFIVRIKEKSFNKWFDNYGRTVAQRNNALKQKKPSQAPVAIPDFSKRELFKGPFGKSMLSVV